MPTWQEELSKTTYILSTGLGYRMKKVFSELNLSPSRLMQVINEDEEAKIQRMDIEINDYPGSGANDRHTPKPPE